MQLKESKTMQNLINAYAGECQAQTRYKFIEYGARMEGYKAMANLIADVIYNEFQHARMMYTFIQSADTKTIDNLKVCSGYPFKEKWNLLDNLNFASIDEGDEEKRIYPQFAKTAREEGFEDVAGMFENIIQVESCHRKLFTQLYEQMKNKTMYAKDEVVKWKCGDCGYEMEAKSAFTECPLCQSKQGTVLIKIEDGAN